MVDKGEGLALVTGNQIGELKVQARDQVGLTETTRGSCLLNRQVVVADRAEQEGLTRLDGTRVVRLEADGALAVHPDFV